MPIPKHNEIRIPVLEYLRTNGPAGSKEMVGPLSLVFKLTSEEVNQMYDSGNGPVFKDRISWAITYLKMAGLISPLKRATYEITPKGIDILKTPRAVDQYIDEQYARREALKMSVIPGETAAEQLYKTEKEEKFTPQEKLYESYAIIKKSVLDEILDTIIAKSPTAFEKFVVRLLQKMGYGEEIKDSGIVTKATRDKGIDGIIKEDVLGFGRIYIQAKKYDRHVPVPSQDLQKFAGALLMVGSNKGVFLTTSRFSGPALDVVKELKQQIVTIDGQQLAEYIYEYGLGLQVEQVLTVKKLDWDFWDEMEDK
jgi:restriction system protein